MEQSTNGSVETAEIPGTKTTGESNPAQQQGGDDPGPLGYGKRSDGSYKDVGFLGELKRPDGNISTEVSIGVEIDGKEVEIPSLVPGLTKDEQDAILRGEMPDSAVDKAVEHARKRMEQGKSPFYSSDTDSPQSPEGEKLSSLPWETSWGDTPDYGEPLQTSQNVPQGKFPWEMEWGDRYVVEEPTEAPRGSQSYSIDSGDQTFDSVFQNLIKQESGGRHYAKDGKLLSSSVGARGITQIMPATGRNPGYGIRPLQNDSEEEYIRFGQDYLQALLKSFNGNYEYAVAAYNAGEGNVRKAIRRAQAAGSSNWISFLPDPGQTGPYVRNILRRG